MHMGHGSRPTTCCKYMPKPKRSRAFKRSQLCAVRRRLSRGMRRSSSSSSVCCNQGQPRVHLTRSSSGCCSSSYRLSSRCGSRPRGCRGDTSTVASAEAAREQRLDEFRRRGALLGGRVDASCHTSECLRKVEQVHRAALATHACEEQIGVRARKPRGHRRGPMATCKPSRLQKSAPGRGPPARA